MTGCLSTNCSYERRCPQGLPFGLDAAFWLVSLLAIVLGASWLVLLLRLEFTAVTLGPTAAMLSLGYVWALRRGRLTASWLEMIVALVLVVLSTIVSVLVLDTSYDGQVYHMLAIYLLRNGWNPIYEPIHPASIWVSHYPKASWLLSAFIYAHVPLIDGGKAVNVLAWWAAFFTARVAIVITLKRFTHWGARVVSLAGSMLAIVTASNPVVMAQLFTYYNDGFLASILLVYIGALVTAILGGCTKGLLIAVMTIPMLLNVKFTGTVYTVILSMPFVFYGFYYLCKNVNKMVMLKVVLSVVAVVVLSLGAIGFNPYVTNFYLKGHPFYPLEGSSRIDIVSANMPEDFVNKSRWEKLYLSLTAKVGNPMRPYPSERRQAFWDIGPEEFRRLWNDTRVAGFGPYMHWIVVAAAATLFITLLSDVRVGLVGCIVVLTIGATIAINPESWWARYVPQLWWVGPCAVLGAWVSRRPSVVIAGWLVAALILWNAGGAAIGALGNQIYASTQLRAQLNSFYDKNQVRIFSQGSSFISIPLRFEELRISYAVVENPRQCSDFELILYSTTYFCH